MARRTLLGLVALVALLAFFWRAKQRELERGGPALDAYPLCPGLEPERVVAIRVDQVERGFQLGFERDAAGRWFMTDPLAYPAQASLLRMLLATLAGASGEPADELRPAEIGLEPPRVVLECDEAAASGLRTTRVEFGAPDLDPAKLYARVPGHPRDPRGPALFRTTRTLATTLDRNPDDYRERRVSALAPDQVVALRRSGTVQRSAGEGQSDLTFDALTTPDGWKSASGAAVSLDPNAMALLVRGACELSAERFVDDSPSDLAPYGLAEPAFVLELELLEEAPVWLEFGHPAVSTPLPLAEHVWFGQRRGFRHVFELRTRDVELLASPADLFYDQLLVRALRSDVVRLQLDGAGTRRVLERASERGIKAWSVRSAPLDGPDAPDAPDALERATRVPANPAAIEDVLGRLESLQLAEHLPGEAFEAAEPELGFVLELASGARQGGRLGRTTRDPKSGAEGRQFLRLGDELVALVDARLVELCATPVDAFRAPRVHQLQESLVRALELERAGRVLAFVNTGDNQWSPRGQEIQAPAAFLQALDKLLNLAAVRWLEGSVEGEELLRVRVLPTQGEPSEFSFLRTPDGVHACRAGTSAAEVDGALVEKLVGLFRP